MAYSECHVCSNIYELFSVFGRRKGTSCGSSVDDVMVLEELGFNVNVESQSE